ncbi:MAG TPA: DUF6288 domain-containing protein [Phycisphaerales bacterium]|nr:DUF6288 domain-containing protein [Phycisphaerales bacterium]HMP36246.1 DUF6288 domain-containing protein [Phycisphaerales bacterium]
MNSLRLLVLLSAAVPAISATVLAQVHYHEDGQPWKQRAGTGPDAEVPGWFYNLGITGIRVELVADEPKALLVRHVFAGSPASGVVRLGDLIVGAGAAGGAGGAAAAEAAEDSGRPGGDEGTAGRESLLFRHPHRNGYGESVFGAHGPISEFAAALETAQGPRARDAGKLALLLRRDGERVEVALDVGTAYGAFGPEFPARCGKSERILSELLEFLARNQRPDGSFGNPIHNTFAPLALLASGDPRHLPAVERCVRMLCASTHASDEGAAFSLPNWTYMGAALVLSEYYLATGAEWVLPELRQVHDFIAAGQYLDMAQINPKARESHPDSFPTGPLDSHGGWGHNPGFEGYGPIAMITAQGALAYSMMARCGIAIDRAHHDAAYRFLKNATGANGYVWYGSRVGGAPDGWADMGRTGAAAIANFLSPYADDSYRERARLHSNVIAAHPQSFPDTHGSPAMGMAHAALGASIEPANFRALMDANRWWFALAQCCDGSFYYQPNRDNAGYGDDARMTASSVTAFILAIPKRSLVITGRPAGGAARPALDAIPAVPPTDHAGPEPLGR